MDSRFNNCSILDRRKQELSPDNIKEKVDLLFQNITLLQDWSYIGSEWADNIKRTNNEEIKKSIIRTLKIRIMNYKGEEIIIPIQFPELVQDQFFYIGGFLKVPIFQLIDKPVIYRKIGSNFLLKIRTNTVSIELEKDAKQRYIVSVYGKKIPIEHLLCSTMSKEEYLFWKDENEQLIEANSTAKDLIEYIDIKCIDLWDELDSEDKRNAIIGEHFMNYPNEKYSKGKNIRFSLKTSYQVDFFNKPYLKCENFILEILQTVVDGYRSDTDVNNKRIRLAEYVISPLIKKVFDMIVSLHKNKDVSYKIPQTIIIENCNVSDIVHYNFPLNPVGEIASLMQCSLTGPNGFKKTNVPLHLRNIDESQFGYICPIDTPDREGCGVVLNMVPTVDITPDGEFGEAQEEIITSYPITLSPFMSADDGTRLQMSSNHCKQAIMIKDSEKSWVRTGIEDAYLDKSTFLGIAKDNGLVIYKDDKFVVIKYDNHDHDVFKINYRPLYLNTMDYIEALVDKNDRVIKDQIITQSKFLRDGELAMGKTFHTLVMPMFGYNYEDGIIISESVAKQMSSSHLVDMSFEIESGQVLLSLTGDSYSPLPKVGDRIKTGQIYAKIKCLDWEDGFEAINEEPIEKTAPQDCIITNIEVYPNQWNHKVEEFNQFIQHMMGEQSSKYHELISSLKECMTENDIKNFITYNSLSYLDCENKMGKYSVKSEVINGVLVKITGVYEENIGVGDKISNRMGNKGCIAKIVPKNEMPVLEDGRLVDIVINPLGIITRMNAGQIYELQVGECLNKLRSLMRELKEPKDEKLLSKILKDIDETPTLWTTRQILQEYEENKKKYGKDEAINRLYFIMPSFQSTDVDTIVEKLMKKLDVKPEFEVTIPELGKIKNKIAAGYMYWYKLVHRASEKLSARSVGTYSQKTNQPLGGKKRGGGHRFGEMEQWALVSHGSNNLLKDLMTIHSDSAGCKNETLSKMLKNTETLEENDDKRPQSLMLLDAYLAQLSLEIE